MNEGHINLRSSDFYAHAFSSFNQQQDKNLYTDVTLVSDDNMQFQAHKLILSAGSDYFRNILSDKAHPHLMLCLDGVTSEDLERVIKYLYVGQVSVPQSSLQRFLKVSHKLKCYGLNEKEPQEYQCSEVGNTQTQQEIEEKEQEQPQVQETKSEIFLETNGTVKDPLPDLFHQETPELDEKIDPLEEKEHQQLEIENAHFEKELEDKEHQQPEVGETNPEIFLETNSTIKEHLPDLLTLKTQELDEKIDIVKDMEGMKKRKVGRPKKNISMVPQFCRINGKTFSHDQLEDILKEQYYRKGERKDGMLYFCLHCDYETKTKWHIIEHSQKHFEFDCDRCRQTFSRMESLRIHLRKRCSGVWVPKFCRIEGRTFSNEELGKIQKELFSRKEDSSYFCKHCDFKNTRRPVIIDHVQSHLQNLEVDCNGCGQSFSDFASLRYHKQRSCS